VEEVQSSSEEEEEEVEVKKNVRAQRKSTTQPR
jgi:hypothetical protein